MNSLTNSLKILLVEDYEVVLKFMNIVLHNAGCKVDLAKSGQHALEYFQNNYYDLIFMDIGLPDANGLSIIELMRQSHDKSKASTPIVITTAHADKEYQSKAENLGVVDFIIKPCSVDDCLNLINKFSCQNIQNDQE